MSHTSCSSLVSIADNKTKTLVYQIPINETKIIAGVNGSQCSDGVDTLLASWDNSSSFSMEFQQNKSDVTVKNYDLASFVITLNVSSLFNDSAGEITHKLQWDVTSAITRKLIVIYFVNFPFYSESSSDTKSHQQQQVRRSIELLVSLQPWTAARQPIRQHSCLKTSVWSLQSEPRRKVLGS